MRDTKSSTWGGVDALGNELPVNRGVRTVRENKFVGIFYSLWHPSIFGLTNERTPCNVHDIISHHPDAIQDPNAPEWNSTGSFYYWGEPLYGYYNLDEDKYVIRKHAQMLSDIGVDALIFDFTNFRENQLFYTKKTLTFLCDTFLEIRQGGGRTPQLICMTTWDGYYSANAATVLYRDFYKPGKYDELWFRWEEKPLIMADKKAVSDLEVLEYFTFRKAHPHYTAPTEPEAWPWLSTTPPHPAFTADNSCEEVAIGAAQNWDNGPSYTFMSAMDDQGNFIARGRSYHNGKSPLLKDPTSSEYPSAQNYNLQESLESALELDPDFLYVTSWNEWIAGRFMEDPFNTGDRLPKGGAFCDAYTAEFSRDIEPTRTGGLGDNAYMILAEAIRRFKGAEMLEPAHQPHRIDIHGDFGQWNNVETVYYDDIGDAMCRDCEGIFHQHLTNESGRNDFAEIKAASDETNLYLYAQTAKAITPYTDSNWMQIFLRTGSGDHWEGYQYMVGRTDTTADRMIIERSTGGYAWEKVGEASYQVKGNEIQVAIPRKDIGCENGEISIQFKWADNLQQPGDILDFYVSGDVAPNGRFNYDYTTDFMQSGKEQ